MPRFTSHPSAWFLILALALVVRLVAGMWWQARLPADQRFQFADSDGYWVLGQAIARGEPYEYHSPDYQVFRAPGYPLLLAGLFRVGGLGAPVLWARALSAVLGTIAVGIAGWWATTLFDARAGRMAGWILALYPGAVSTGVFVLSEAPFCPLMLLDLALWSAAWRSPSSGRALGLSAAGGAAAALATLMRPSWLLFTPFALLIGLAFDRRRGRQLLVGAMMCASFALVMLPWWVRNFQLVGHFIPTTLQVGASLYDGWNPQAEGGSHMEFVSRFAAAEHARDGIEPNQKRFEYRLDRRMERAALDWARAHPRRVAQLAWIKFVRIWNVWPNESAFRHWPLRVAVLLTYAPLVGLSLLGVWRFSGRGWPYVLAWLPAVYLTMLHVIFVGSIRYREPAMLALAVLAAGVLAGYSRGHVPLAAALPAS